jgi:hypothetical protein
MSTATCACKLPGAS